MDRRQLGKQLLERFDDLRGKVLTTSEPRGTYRVLAYRRFWPPSPDLRKAFEAQLDHLRREYAVRSLPEVVQGLREGYLPEEGTISITVDGGHQDFLTLAYPVLRSHGLAATVFLPTGFIDGGVWLWFDRIIHAVRNTRAALLDITFPGELPVAFPLADTAQKRAATGQLLQALQRLPPYERDPLANEILERLGMLYPPYPPAEFAPLTWDQVSEMWPNNVSFGAHTVSHPMLTSLPSEGAIHAEVCGAKQRIEQKLGVDCTLLSYPAGAFDERVVQVAKNCGLQGAVTSEPGRNAAGADPFRLRRINVEPSLPPAQFAQACKGNQ